MFLLRLAKTYFCSVFQYFVSLRNLVLYFKLIYNLSVCKVVLVCKNLLPIYYVFSLMSKCTFPINHHWNIYKGFLVNICDPTTQNDVGSVTRGWKVVRQPTWSIHKPDLHKSTLSSSQGTFCGTFVSMRRIRHASRWVSQWIFVWRGEVQLLFPNPF